MAAHAKMSHTGSDGSSPFDRIKAEGYRFEKAGENVAYGQPSVAEVMRSWMDSRPHRENILGDFTEIGVAVEYAEDGTPYWCVDFGRPWPQLTAADAEKGVVESLNAARSAEKQPALAVAPVLSEEAARHASEMAASGSFKPKEGEPAPSPLRRVSERTDRYVQLAEFDASGVPSAEKAVANWLSNDETKKTILGDFGEVGVGYAPSKEGPPYWCLLLGKPAGE